MKLLENSKEHLSKSEGQRYLAGILPDLYKSEQHGGYVQLVDRWFASSKTCHHCRWVKEDLTLADREWRCERCRAVNQRDLNAAQNIKEEAIRQISGVPVVASSARKFGRREREALARWRQRVKLPAGKQVQKCRRMWLDYMWLCFWKQQSCHYMQGSRLVPA